MAAHLDFLGVVQCPNGPFVICYACRYVVGVKGALSKHLRNEHELPPSKSAPLLAARSDVAELALKTLGRRPAPWPNDVQPAPGLPTFSGFECTICEYRCESKEHIRRHVGKRHQDLRGVSYQYYMDAVRVVQMQTWFRANNGGLGIWWRVSRTGPMPPVYPGLLVYNCDVGLRERAQRFVLAPPYQPVKHSQMPEPPITELQIYPIPEDLLAEPHLVGTQCKDDASPYIQRTNWLQTFAQLDHWQAMRQLTYLPKTRDCIALPLQLQHHGQDLIGSAFNSESEGTLLCIVQQMPAV
jgi:hypothetical protein